MSICNNVADLHSANVDCAYVVAGADLCGFHHTDLHCELCYIMVTCSEPEVVGCAGLFVDSGIFVT